MSEGHFGWFRQLQKGFDGSNIGLRLRLAFGLGEISIMGEAWSWAEQSEEGREHSVFRLD